MKRKKGNLIALFQILFFIFPLILACAHLEENQGKTSEIAYDISPSAQVTKVSYFLKQLEGAQKLFFEIGIKNVSKENHKYRAAVLLNEGPSGSALYPVKEEGKLGPGKELALQFPIFYDRLPKGFTLIVETYD
jgi:hypothetical protein